MEKELKGKNQLNIMFDKWKNFDIFLDKCKEENIQKLYITGQNTDSLLYTYLEELIDYLQDNGFKVGLRTNGLLAMKQMFTINKCKEEIGLTMQSLSPLNNYKIVGTKEIPNWIQIAREVTAPWRMSIVLNRHNQWELLTMLKYLSQFPKMRYVQIRKVSTDTREEFHEPDQRIFDDALRYFSKNYPSKSEIEGAPIFRIFGMDVVFWKTVETTVNSLNYFTDGVVSDEYFIVEGYKKYSNLPSPVK